MAPKKFGIPAELKASLLAVFDESWMNFYIYSPKCRGTTFLVTLKVLCQQHY